MELENKIDEIISEFKLDIDLNEYEKRNDLVVVDAYWIPEDEAMEYIRDRELLALIATEIFTSEGFKVERDFAGSQEGEAIIGLENNGEIARFIHLDPYSIEGLKDAIKNNENVIDYILFTS